MSAALVRFAGNAVADLEIRHALTNLHDAASPLVSGDEGVMRRPFTGEMAVKRARIRAADGHAADLAEHLTLAGLGDGHVGSDLERAGACQHTGLHGLGNLISHGSTPSSFKR